MVLVLTVQKCIFTSLDDTLFLELINVAQVFMGIKDIN